MSQAIAAPSAAPGTVAPAQPATPPPVAPATPAGEQPLTLADFDRLASESLRANETARQPQPAEPAQPAAGTESPTAATEAEPQPEPAPSPAAEAEPAGEIEDSEPTPEEQSAWTDGERRLHGALVKERQARKEARNELKELRALVDELRGKAAPANPNEPPRAEPAATASPAPTPSVAAPALTECETFEAIDARVMAAATAEAAAMRLQQTLLRQGYDAVLPQLAQHGVTVHDGMLVDASSKTVLGEANEQTVGEFIANVFSGAKQTQAQAPVRKQFLVAQGQAWNEAVKMLPDLANEKSETFRRITHFVQSNPIIRQQPSWPVTAAKLFLGEQAWNSKAKPAAATVPSATPPKLQTPPSAPGAPRTSVSSLPKRSEMDDLAAKIKSGTATLQDVDRLAALRLQANSTR